MSANEMIVKIVSKNFDIPDSHKLDVALANGRYESIDKFLLWLQMK